MGAFLPFEIFFLPKLHIFCLLNLNGRFSSSRHTSSRVPFKLTTRRRPRSDSLPLPTSPRLSLWIMDHHLTITGSSEEPESFNALPEDLVPLKFDHLFDSFVDRFRESNLLSVASTSGSAYSGWYPFLLQNVTFNVLNMDSINSLLQRDPELGSRI